MGGRSWLALGLACLSGVAPAQSPATPAVAPTAAGAGAHDPKTPRPLDHFAEVPALEGPHISPDGKRIATRLAAGGEQYLAIVELDTGKKRLVGGGKEDLNWWRWVNNDWLVLGIGAQTNFDGSELYVRRAVGLSSTSNKIVQLATGNVAQIADDVIWFARDGSPRILLALQRSPYLSDSGFWPEVIEVDVSTGKSKRVMAPREGVFDWAADSEGVVRMGVGRSTDGRTMRVLYRQHRDEPLRQIVRPTREHESVIIPQLFLREPGKAIVLADDPAGHGAIYDFDIDTLKLGRKLYASAGYDVAGFATTTDGRIAGISYLENAGRQEWIEPDLIALQREVSAKVRGGSARLFSYSADYKRAIVFAGATSSPGAYYLYDRPSGEMELLAMANAQIGASRLNPVRTIRYKARDGLEIAAVLTLPRLRPARALPLIVLPHGGPFARDSEEWDWWAQALAERGYAVVQPNYRGSSGYGTPFAKKGEGQWGLAMQDDLIDAIADLARQGIADPKRVCIVGASYGGYAAMRAAQRDTAHYRCAISYAGVSDLNRMRKYDARFLNSGVRSDWMKRQATDFREVSPLTAPERTALPLLLMHGKEDRVVPVAQSRVMAERLRQAGKPVTYIEQPQGDHHFSRSEDRLQFLKAMQAFLDQHNPA